MNIQDSGINLILVFLCGFGSLLIIILLILLNKSNSKIASLKSQIVELQKDNRELLKRLEMISTRKRID